MFVDFKRIFETTRERLPLGIAQIGTVLRNEISPRQGPIRLREFTIMEFEFFFDPEAPECSLLPNVENDQLPLVTIPMREQGQEEPLMISVKDAIKTKQIVTEWGAYFMAVSKRYLSSLGIPADKQRFHEKLKSERAHYSRQTFDHEVLLDRWGWVELAGHAYRTDYDLAAHTAGSGVDMSIFKPYAEPTVRKRKFIYPIGSKIGPAFKEKAPEITRALVEADPDRIEREVHASGMVEVGGVKLSKDFFEIREETVKETGRKFIPHVIEPSYGAERAVYAALEYAYSRREDRVVLRLPFDLAPTAACVFPLMAKDGLDQKATSIHGRLIDAGFECVYDDAGTIGRRYARADEIGVPVSITVDYESLKDSSVTFRDRDSWAQVRVGGDAIVPSLRDYLDGKVAFGKLGPTVSPPSD